MMRRVGIIALAVHLVFASSASAVTFGVSFTQIVQQGDPAPAGGTFSNYGDTVVDDDGNVAVNANVSGGNETNVVGNGGPLTEIATDETMPPGAGFTLTNLDDHIEIRDGATAYFGSVPADGIFVGDGVTTRVVVQEGATPIPFGGGTTTDFNLTNSEGFGFDGTRVAFEARSIAGNSANNGLFVEDGAGNIVKLVDSNDAPPVALGTSYGRFDDPMPDANGAGVVFKAEIDGGATDALLLFDGSEVLLIDSVTGSDSLGIPDIDAGQIVYSKVVGGQESLNLYDGSAVTSIVTVGDTINTQDGSVTILGLQESVYGIANGVVGFIASDAGAEDVFLLWSNGMFTQVLRDGSMILGQTVTSLTGDTRRPFMADGFFALDIGLDGLRTVVRGEFSPVPLPASAVLLLAALAAAGIVGRQARA